MLQCIAPCFPSTLFGKKPNTIHQRFPYAANKSIITPPPGMWLIDKHFLLGCFMLLCPVLINQPHASWGDQGCDPGLSMGWSSRSRHFLQVASECSTSPTHWATLATAFPSVASLPKPVAHVADSQFLSELCFIAGLLLYPALQQNK